MPDALHVQFAVPDDPDLDTFTTGDSEVDAYFRSRRWFNSQKGEASPPTYEFRSAAFGEPNTLVGYAAAEFRNCEHPCDAATSKAKYLVIYAFGVDQRLHGARNPVRPDQTFSSSVLGVLEGFAAGKAGCVGLRLWVRADNARAIAFYRKVGFSADPAGPVQRDEGSAHLTMRKRFAVP